MNTVPFPHAHYFSVQTGTNQGHAHVLPLFTYPVNGTAYDGHIHWYQGTTIENAGHFHRVVGKTGPAVALPNGEHTHRIEAETDSEPFEFREGYYKTVLTIPRHTHAYTGYTSVPIGREPENW